MTVYFLGFLILLITSLSLSMLLNKKFGFSFIFTIFSIIITLYIFGLIGIMFISPYFFAVAAVGLLVFAIIKFIRKKQLKDSFVKVVSSFTFIFICFFMILQSFLLVGRLCSFYDEFSHWALVCKNMFNWNDFGNSSNAIILFPGYPPATGLFTYFFQSLGNSFVEANLYRAFNLLIVGVYAAISETFDKKWYFKFIFIIFIHLVASKFYSVFDSIYVDAILGLMMAFILILYFNKKETKFKWILMSFSCFILTLIKEVGFSLCLMIFVVIYLDKLVLNRKDEFFQKNKKKCLFWILLFLPVILTIVSKCSWKIYLKITNNPSAWNVSALTMGGVFKFIFSPNEFQLEVTKKFLRALFSYQMLIFVTLMFFIIIGLKNKRKLALGIELIVFFVIYAVSLLLLYLFTYSVYEAQNLAGLTRYMNTMALVLSVIIVYELAIFMQKIEQKSIVILLLILSFSTLPVDSLYTFIFKSRETTNSSIYLRSELKYIEKFAKNLDKKDSIYFMEAGGTGYIRHIAQYEANPVRISDWGWSLGESRYSGDVWSVNYSVDILKDILKNYTYVCVHKTDDIFKNTYGQLFEGEIKNKTFYKVDMSGENLILRQI